MNKAGELFTPKKPMVGRLEDGSTTEANFKVEISKKKHLTQPMDPLKKKFELYFPY